MSNKEVKSDVKILCELEEIIREYVLPISSKTRNFDDKLLKISINTFLFLSLYTIRLKIYLGFISFGN